VTRNRIEGFNELLQRLKSNYERVEGKEYLEAEDHEMAGWYRCKRCGKSSLRFNPLYSRTHQNILKHEYECDPQLSSDELES